MQRRRLPLILVAIVVLALVIPCVANLYERRMTVRWRYETAQQVSTEVGGGCRGVSNARLGNLWTRPDTVL